MEKCQNTLFFQLYIIFFLEIDFNLDITVYSEEHKSTYGFNNYYLWPMLMDLKVLHTSESPERLVKIQIAGSSLSELVCLGEDPRIWISNKSSGDADASGPETTLWEADL